MWCWCSSFFTYFNIGTVVWLSFWQFCHSIAFGMYSTILLKLSPNPVLVLRGDKFGRILQFLHLSLRPLCHQVLLLYVHQLPFAIWAIQVIPIVIWTIFLEKIVPGWKSKFCEFHSLLISVSSSRFLLMKSSPRSTWNTL